MTYFDILKKSPRLIKEGFPGKEYWSQTWLEITTIWGGIKGLTFQIFALMLWLFIVCTCPISLPLLSLLSFLYRDKMKKKRQAEINAKIDALHSRQKSKSK